MTELKMRHLPPALKEHFDQAINWPAQAMGPLTSTEFLLLAAQSSVGITEIGGDNKGPWVELFQTTISRPQGQSWCLDFLQACIAYGEERSGAVSELPATEHVLTFWEQAKAYSAVQPPRIGDLILWRHGNTLNGHCGLIVGMDSLRYQTIEGNTGPSHEIERDGDGVYLKNRAKGGSSTFVEIGFLRVFS